MRQPRGEKTARPLDRDAVLSLFSERQLERMFEKSVRLSGGCLVFTGASAGPSGHRRIVSCADGERVPFMAHRVSYALAGNRLEAGDDLLHSLKCVSPACIEPTHLRPGNQAENMADRKAAGHYPSRGTT